MWITVNKHPDADGLYVEQIDFGEPEGPRTVVSGLVNYIAIEQMRDKYLVGVVDLHVQLSVAPSADLRPSVQLEAGEHAWGEELRHGALRNTQRRQGRWN